jgi:cytidylate kinase
MTDVRIIGLCGTNGAGKDLVGELLASRHNYLFISVTELLRQEAKRRNVPVERQYLRQISAEWRREQGLSVLVDQAMAAFNQVADQYDGVVMASLRNPAEADRIHELGGTMLWIDADPKVRYNRITGADRGRGGEDNKTFEQFLHEEAAEMHKPADGDAASLNMLAVKERCDQVITNDSAEIDALDRSLVEALGLA